MNKTIFNIISFKICSLLVRTCNTPIHGREVARKLHANQKTVQNHLNILYDAKILQKKKAGKNIMYTLENTPRSKAFIECSNNYNAVCLMNDFEIREILKDITMQTKKPVIVFGSYAKMTNTKGSDIDIILFEKIKDIQHKYSKKIHIITLELNAFEEGIIKKDNFIIEVLNNHIVLNNSSYLTQFWLEKYGKD
jgi:predicted nucleotidyltransferase